MLKNTIITVQKFKLMKGTTVFLYINSGNKTNLAFLFIQHYS